ILHFTVLYLIISALKAVLKFIDVFESNYPEILRCCYIVNVAFSIMKPFISEKTLNKIKIYGKNGWKEELLKVIEADQLPVHWGGTMTDPDGNTKCISKICIGGKVPKEYYLKNKLLALQNQNLHLDFKSHITLKKAESKIFEFQVFENVGSQLRWEFRSTGCDIAYEISRTTSEEVEELIPLQRVNSQIK
ncbi:SEC14-like protein 2, partial [Armadillidium vulgare]